MCLVSAADQLDHPLLVLAWIVDQYVSALSFTVLAVACTVVFVGVVNPVKLL